jgi:hypothetical protein
MNASKIAARSAVSMTAAQALIILQDQVWAAPLCATLCAAPDAMD